MWKIDSYDPNLRRQIGRVLDYMASEEMEGYEESIRAFAGYVKNREPWHEIGEFITDVRLEELKLELEAWEGVLWAGDSVYDIRDSTEEELEKLFSM